MAKLMTFEDLYSFCANRVKELGWSEAEKAYPVVSFSPWTWAINSWVLKRRLVNIKSFVVGNGKSPILIVNFGKPDGSAVTSAEIDIRDDSGNSIDKRTISLTTPLNTLKSCAPCEFNYYTAAIFDYIRSVIILEPIFGEMGE